MKSPLTLALVTLMTCAAKADIERFSLEKTNALTIKSEDGSATLHVEVERFDRDKLKTIQKGEEFSIWYGERQLPFDVIIIPTMIKKFDLTIDGKKVAVPKNFWNDIGGFQLRKLVVDPKRPVKTPEDQDALERFMAENDRSFPSLSRTPQGSTILITWVRPEE